MANDYRATDYRFCVRAYEAKYVALARFMEAWLNGDLCERPCNFDAAPY